MGVRYACVRYEELTFRNRVATNDRVILIEKHFRGTTSRSVRDVFWKEVERCERKEDVCPIIVGGQYCLISIYAHEMFFVATVKREVNALLVIELLALV